MRGWCKRKLPRKVSRQWLVSAFGLIAVSAFGLIAPIRYIHTHEDYVKQPYEDD